MPITRTISNTQIEAWVRGRVESFISNIIQTLHNVGLEATTIARQQAGYTFQTGNLGSSTGYVILYNGQVQDVGNFNVERGEKGEGSEGSAIGMNMVNQMESLYPAGLVLIVVAGMPYAYYVESRGYNVLKKSEEYAVQEVRNKINDVLNLYR